MSADELRPTLDALLAETQWVRALARSLVVDPGTADDVAQDAAVLALTKPPADAGALRGWLRRVVKNLASNARRGESRRGAREHAVARSEPDEAADETVARWEVRKQVVEAVLGLGEPYRSTILLRFFDGLTAAQAAARQGVPLETVRTRTRRGVEILRGRLAHLDDGKGKRGMAVLLVLAHREADFATAGSGAAAGSVLGGAAMASATKWIGAAAFLALFGGGMTWAIVTARDANDRHAAAVASAELRPAVPVRTHRAPRPADGSATLAPDGVDLDSCDRARDLFGVVVGPDGRPVAGARVQALRMRPYGRLISERGFVDPFVPGEETKSGFDGTFALRLAPHDTVTLRAEATGFADWESWWRQAGERVRVELVPGATIRVLVTTHAGDPVPAADVRVSGLGGSAGTSTTARRHAVTGADGTIAFTGVPRSARLFLHATPASHPPAYREIQLTDAAEQSFTVALGEGRAFRVTVLDAASRAPIAGAEVRWNGGSVCGTTGPDGVLDFADAPSESGATFEASADGYAAQTLGVTAKQSAATIALPHEASIAARVVDSGGGPVAGADVVAVEEPAQPSDARRSQAGGATAADGRILLRGLAPGSAYALRVRTSDGRTAVRRATTQAAEPWTTDLGDLRVTEGRTLVGRVVDRDDRPVVRFDVLLTGSGDARTDLLREHRRTDDLGRFAFTGLPAGEFRLTAQSDTEAALRETEDVTVPGDRDPAPLTIRLGAAAAAKTTFPVRARVTDENGVPVAGIRVQFGYAANGTTGTRATGADGAVEAAAEHEPQVALVYLSDEQRRTWLPPELWLRPGQRDVPLTLRRGVAISGKVVDDEGRPLGGAFVQAWTGTARVAWGTTNGNGEFAFAVPSGGRVDLEAAPQDAPGVRSKSVGELRDVEPGASDLAVRVVREPSQRTVEVETVDEAGTPVVGAWIQTEFRGEDWSKPLSGTTGADGRCRIESLPRGPVIVSATIPDVAAGPNHHWTASAVRVAGDRDSVRLVVPKPRLLRGRVVLEDGAPVAGAVVHGGPNNVRQGSMTIAGPDGRFEIRVPPDAPPPFPLRANPFPPDPKNPLTGWDLVEAEDREYEIVVHTVPKR